MATEKERLNQIIKQLDEKQIAEIVDFAEFLRNKAEKIFWNNIPVDDETVSEEDLKAVREGEEDLKSGTTLSYEEVFGKE